MKLGRVFRKGVRALGRMLVEAGLVGRNVVREALKQQQELKQAGRPHKPLGQILVERECISEEELHRLLREQVDALLIRPRPGKNGVWVLELYGYIDAYTHELLEEALNTVISEGRTRLVIDCSHLDYMNSDGVGPILSARRKARAQGGDVVVCSLGGKAAVVFEVLGLDKFITVCDSLDDAFAVLSGELAEPEEPEPVRFVASIKGRLFHREDCPQVRRIGRGNRVVYVSRGEALRSGKKPCSRCCADYPLDGVP